MSAGPFRKMMVTKAVEGMWVSYCPDLDIYSQGETEERARQALYEAVVMVAKYWRDKHAEDTAPVPMT